MDPQKKKILNEKIKKAMDLGNLEFEVEDGKLVAIGHFAGGSDTIGHNEFNLLGWEDFIEHS